MVWPSFNTPRNASIADGYVLFMGFCPKNVCKSGKP
jgi:hypothetical protein